MIAGRPMRMDRRYHRAPAAVAIGAVVAVLAGVLGGPVAAQEPSAKAKAAGETAVRAKAAREVASLQTAIDETIDKGVACLIRRQQRDGSWHDDAFHYPCGQTGLSLYTLLKGDVSPNHPAIRRGFAFLRARRPRETYSLACAALAYSALGDAADLPRLQQIVEDLTAFDVRGLHSYPFGHDPLGWNDKVGAVDLSNTQYAALGLKAAQQAGAKVPPEVWITLAEGILLAQAKPTEETLFDGFYGRRVPAAGWGYTPGSKPYGSMTASGVGTLAICREMLGAHPLSGKFTERIKTSIERGMAWLGVHFDAAVNPFTPHAEGYILYWLYSIERVGAFLKVDMIGGRPWYLEGAKEILKRRKDDGLIPGGGHTVSDTCFGVLFLRKASARSTGGGSSRKPPTFEFASEAAPVRFRVTGGDDGGPLTFFILGFGEAETAMYGGVEGAAVRGLRVRDVRWKVGDNVVAEVNGDPKRGRAGQDYAARWTPPTRGAFSVSVEVVLVPPEAAYDDVEPTAMIESGPLEASVAQLIEPWMEDAAAYGAGNLLTRFNCEVTASTTNNDGQKPKRVVDGLEGTAWSCKPDDPAPSITITPSEPIKADALVLTHFSTMPQDLESLDTAETISVRINGGPPTTFALEADPYRPTRLPLGSRIAIKSLEISVVKRRTGKAWPGSVGFAEIGLELRNPK